MKTEIIQEKFAKALSHINKAISGRPSIPVLNNVLIEAQNSIFKLSSTNLEMGINVNLAAQVEKEGKMTVSARLLFEFVSSLKPGKLSIIEEGTKLVVKSVDNTAEFVTISADEFPTVPVATGKAIVRLRALLFAKAIEKTAFSASTDTARPVLTGVLLKITEHKLTLVAVDGFRLSQKQISLKEGANHEFNQIVPAKTLLEVARIIRSEAQEKDMIELFFLEGKNQLIFKLNEIELATRLIEGEFPAYEDILPVDKQHAFSALKVELADAVKIVGIFARNVIGNKARFIVKPDQNHLVLSSEVIDMGKNEAICDIVNTSGELVETAYNARFLQDMINAIEGEEIIYETNGPSAPGVFKDKEDSEYIHIIMPMRLE